jgi:hypothetical protein
MGGVLRGMSSLEDATWLYGALSTGIVHMEQQRLLCVAMMVSNVCGRDSLGSGQEVTQWMLGVNGKAAGAAAEEEGAAAEAAGTEVRSCAMISLRIALKRVGATVTQGWLTALRSMIRLIDGSKFVPKIVQAEYEWRYMCGRSNSLACAQICHEPPFTDKRAFLFAAGRATKDKQGPGRRAGEGAARSQER